MKAFQRLCGALGLSLLLSAAVWAVYLAVVHVIQDAHHQLAAVEHTKGWFAIPIVLTVLAAVFSFVLAFMREDK